MERQHSEYFAAITYNLYDKYEGLILLEKLIKTAVENKTITKEEEDLIVTAVSMST